MAETRREFLKVAAVAGVAAGMSVLERGAQGQTAGPELTKVGAGVLVLSDMPYRVLGKTGEKVSLVGLGGYHVGAAGEEACTRMIRRAIDNGLNFLDNSCDYMDGVCEERMGKALKDGYRAKAFLMTKVNGRTKAMTAKQIDECLKRLDVDHVDLMQFHEIIRLTDPDRIFAAAGGMEALLAAQKAGKVRYIGFTGHKDPSMHLNMLEAAKKAGVHFDAVQMPLNVMDAHYKSFEKQVVPVLVKDGTGVLAMKVLGFGAILGTKAVTVQECWNYVMNLPISTLIAGIGNDEHLTQLLKVAKAFKPLTGAEVAAILAKTEKLAAEGQYEAFKSSDRFDGTTRNPASMG